MINELFSMKALSEKAILLQTGAFKPPEHVEEINLTHLELFKVMSHSYNDNLAFQKVR